MLVREGEAVNDLAHAQVVPDWKPEKTRKLAVRPKPVKKAAEPKTVKEQRAAWYAAVMAKKLSVIYTADEYSQIVAGEKVQLHAHHICSQQLLRRHGIDPWADPRNGCPVTKRRHERHHNRTEPIQRSELPLEFWAFLAEYPKLAPAFNKTYGLDATASAVASSNHPSTEGNS